MWRARGRRKVAAFGVLFVEVVQVGGELLDELVEEGEEGVLVGGEVLVELAKEEEEGVLVGGGRQATSGEELLLLARSGRR